MKNAILSSISVAFCKVLIPLIFIANQTPEILTNVLNKIHIAMNRVKQNSLLGLIT